MLHIQNQRFSSYSSPFLSTFYKTAGTDRPVWAGLKYAIKRWYVFVILLASILSPLQLQAANSAVDDRVSFRVADQTREVREQAFQRGLEKILIRISGDSGVMDKLKPTESRRYVQQFRYEPLNTSVIDSQGELLTQRLKIRYNKELIKQYLRENGLVEDDSQNSENQALVHIEIEAVNSMTKYNQVENYLTQLNTVKSVNPLSMDSDKASFEIVLRNSEAAFLSKLDNDRRFIKVKVKKVPEQTNDTQQNSSVVSKEQKNTAFDKFSNNEKKRDLQPEVDAAQNQPPTIPSVIPETEAKQTPVYHYRFVQ